MENKNELDNSENVQENEGGEPSEETLKSPEDLALKLKELEEKNKQLFERAKKAEEKLKEIKPEIKSKEEPKEEPKGTEKQDPKVMVRLAKALNDFSEEEIDFIYRNAKDNSPESIIEASKDEWVKMAINAKREKVAKEKQIPEPGNLPGANPIKGLTPEDIAKDPNSHQKAWEEFMRTGKKPGAGI